MWHLVGLPRVSRIIWMALKNKLYCKMIQHLRSYLRIGLTLHYWMLKFQVWQRPYTDNGLQFLFCLRTLPKITKRPLVATEKQLSVFELSLRARPFLRASKQPSSTNALSTKNGFENLTGFCWVKPICQNSSETVSILPRSNRVRRPSSSSATATTRRRTAR